MWSNKSNSITNQPSTINLPLNSTSINLNTINNNSSSSSNNNIHRITILPPQNRWVELDVP